MKILAVCSKGGHLSELNQITQSLEQFKTVYVTEASVTDPKIDYHMLEGTRSQKLKYLITFMKNSFQAFKIIRLEKPDLIISTGAHTCVPFYLLSPKKTKRIYIESFAKVNTGSLTYKLIKHRCDIVIVQHESMLKVYKKAIYLGGVY